MFLVVVALMNKTLYLIYKVMKKEVQFFMSLIHSLPLIRFLINWELCQAIEYVGEMTNVVTQMVVAMREFNIN